MLVRILLAVCITITGLSAKAGVFEVSATGSYRKTHFDATHSGTMQSATAGLAYYFWELSALESSYTRGEANQIQPEYNAYQTFTSYGLNLLVTIANRESALKPYLKAGASYTVKDLRYIIPNFAPLTISSKGLAPVGGFGFKLLMGQQFALKFGVDVSTSPIDNNGDPVTYDFALNGGISFLF